MEAWKEMNNGKKCKLLGTDCSYICKDGRMFPVNSRNYEDGDDSGCVMVKNFIEGSWYLDEPDETLSDKLEHPSTDDFNMYHEKDVKEAIKKFIEDFPLPIRDEITITLKKYFGERLVE